MSKNQEILGFIPKGHLISFALVTMLFLIWGIPNNMNDILIKQFMKSFELTRFQAGLIQSAFYLGYFLLAVPSGLFMKRYSYKAGLCIGLLLFAGARFVLIGLQKGDISFSHPDFHKREGTLMSSRNAARADFEHVVSSMKKKLIDAMTYITHRTDFSMVKADFESWLDPDSNVIKAMVSISNT